MERARYTPEDPTPSLPRVIYNDRLNSPDIPYEVWADPVAWGKFLKKHGMPDEEIEKLSIELTRKVKVLGINFFGLFRGTKRKILLACDPLWHYYGSVGNYAKVQETPRHEAKHAIDHTSRRHRIEYKMYTLGMFGGAAGVGVGFAAFELPGGIGGSGEFGAYASVASMLLFAGGIRKKIVRWPWEARAEKFAEAIGPEEEALITFTPRPPDPE